MNELISLTASGLTVDGITTVKDIVINANPTVPNINFPALTDTANLQIANNPLLTNVSLPALRAYTGPAGFQLFIQSNALLASINLNALLFSSSAIAIMRNDVLTALQLDALVCCHMGFGVSLNPLLTTLSLPALVLASPYSAFFGFEAYDCDALANVSFPKYLPTKGRKQNFKDCALTEASVDHILSRCIASANYTSGIVDVSGGTSAPPSATGLADKATLIARGCVVITN